MGGPGQCIEIGVISLGTSSQVNGKQVTLINISLGTSAPSGKWKSGKISLGPSLR